LVGEINYNVANQLVYPKLGIKKSLHRLGIQKEFSNESDGFPNNLYLMDKLGNLKYASLSPMRMYVRVILNIINKK